LLFTAGDRHRLPLWVRTPHLGLWCKGKGLCVGAEGILVEGAVMTAFVVGWLERRFG
jgi:hypothetical protein